LNRRKPEHGHVDRAAFPLRFEVTVKVEWFKSAISGLYNTNPQTARS
jgi:hypothetical protein